MESKDRTFKLNISQKIGYSIIVVLLLKLIDTLYSYYFHTHRVDGNFGLTEMINYLLDFNNQQNFSNHDSGWYQNIIENGYTKLSEPKFIYSDETGNLRQSNWAFFPLYPLIVSVVKILFSFTTLEAFFVSGMLINLGLVFQLFTYFELKKIEIKSALYGFLILFFLPFHYYSNCFFTEGLFLFLFILIHNSMQKNKIWLASIGVGLLTITRPTGVFFLPLFFLHNIQFEFNSKLFINEIIENIKRYYLLIIFGVLFFGLWLIYQKQNTGTFTAFMEVQKAWHRTRTFPLSSLYNSGNFQNQFFSTYILLLLLFTIVYFVKLKKKIIEIQPLSFIFVGVMLPLSTGTVESIIRYSSILFPYHLESGKYVARFHWGIRFLFLFLLIYFHFWSFNLFLKSDSISY